MSGPPAAEIAGTLAEGVLYFPLEMTAAALLFSWPLKRREHFALRLLLACSACTSLMVACEVISYGRFRTAPSVFSISASQLSLSSMAMRSVRVDNRSMSRW